MHNNTNYNGWKNYETWNVSLWVNNDEGLYNIARPCKDYSEFTDKLKAMGEVKTLDGVRYGDCMYGYGVLDVDALDELIREME